MRGVPIPLNDLPTLAAKSEALYSEATVILCRSAEEISFAAVGSDDATPATEFRPVLRST